MKILINIYLLYILSIPLCSYGQNRNCNQLTTGGIPKVPKDICIPTGYHITEVFKCEDLNLDGLDDYAFTYKKIKPADGDTTYLAIYYAASDTTYTLKEIYNNLYPIIFTRYDLSYSISDSLLNEIQGRYNGNYPLNWIKFLEGKIVLSIIQGYKESLILHFTYDQEKDDWLLSETEFNEEYNDQTSTTRTEYKGDDRISIKNFNYFDWL